MDIMETCELAVAKTPIEARQGIEKGLPFVVRGWMGERGEVLKELRDPQHLMKEYGGVYVDAMVAVSNGSSAQDQPIHFAGNISDHVSKHIRLGDVLEGCVEHESRQSRRGGGSADSVDLAYYVAQQPLTGELQGLGDKIPLPPDFFPRGAKVSRHLWISSYRSKSSLHFDAQCNMLCVINGRKTVRLARPEDIDNAYPIWTEQYNHSQEAMSCCRGTVYQASICQGDAIHIPKYWWHEVESDKWTIAANFWWNEGPHPAQLQHESQESHCSSTLISLKEATRAAILRQVDMLIAGVPPLSTLPQNRDTEKERDETAADPNRTARAHAEHIVQACSSEMAAQSSMCPIVAELLSRKFEEHISGSVVEIDDQVFFEKLYSALDSGTETGLTAAKILEQKEKLHELCYKAVLQKYME